MNATPVLIGNKTILRPVHPSDAPIFTRWMNDPKTRRYLLRRFPVTEMAEEAWIKKNAELSQHPTDLVFVIETKGDNKPVGTMGLHNINWRRSECNDWHHLGRARISRQRLRNGCQDGAPPVRV